MKKIITTFLLMVTILVQGQDNFTKLIEIGISHHDKGNYEEAIDYYKKALKLKPGSELANYEISLSYFSLKDFKKTVKYCDKILKKGKEHLLPAYINKGNALDMLGKTKKSIKVFEEGIEKVGDNYLLHFNLAINYLKINEYDNAEKHFKKAILDNPLHGSSHFYLAKINDAKKERVPALLASYYFLFVEPESLRAEEIYNILKKNLNTSVNKDKDGKNITINLSTSDLNSEFTGIEMMMSVMEISKKEKEKDGKEKSESEVFVEKTKQIFTLLGDFSDKKDEKSIWWNFYVPFFSKVGNSDHIETYCKFISQLDIKSKIWIENNEDKMRLFIDWLEKEFK